MNRVSKFFKRCAVWIAATVAGLVPAFASSISSAQDLIDTASDELKTSADSFVNLVLIIIGLAGVVATIIGAVKYFKADHDSENALFKVGIGVVIAVIIIFVIKAVMLQ